MKRRIPAWCVKVLKRHALVVILTIVGIVVGVCLYYSGQQSKMPKYSVRQSQLVAKITEQEPRLQLLWESKPIANAASVGIAIWNAGDMYFGNESLSEADPVRIVSDEDVRILAVNQIARSRDTLEFEYRIVQLNGEKQDTILVRLANDDALEKRDGALFYVLFTGSVEADWKVIGRVKGAPKGFQEVEWQKACPTSESRILPIIMSFLVLIMLLVVAVAFVVLPLRRKTRIDWVYVLGCLAIGIAWAIQYVPKFKILFTALPWLSGG